MINLQIKIITGFRADQYYTFPVEEAHKAYYLFLHPEERGVFKNGVAIRGVDIKGIEPDYHATMGWNPTHNLDSDDWNEIRGKKVDTKLRTALIQAQEVAKLPDPQMNRSLTEAITALPPKTFSPEVSALADSKRIS